MLYCAIKAGKCVLKAYLWITGLQHHGGAFLHITLCFCAAVIAVCTQVIVAKRKM